MKAHEDWKEIIQKELNKDYYKNLISFLEQEEEAGKTIFPKKENIFNALSISPKEVKVVIIGQDPYHGENQAHGFSFSVEDGIKPPPSLVNIYKEIENEYGYSMNRKTGNLTPWVKQGVLLLNAILTVEKNNASSHKGRGWENFTDEIIKGLSENTSNIVFLLWGNFAQSKEKLIDSNKHSILKSPHPSPFSAHNGFFGNNHFKKANKYLASNNLKEIDWKIT